MSSPESRGVESMEAFGGQFIKEIIPDLESSKESITKNWLERGYTEIKKPFITQERFLHITSLFSDFCRDVPGNIKKELCIPGPGGRGKGSVGYVRRTPEDGDPEDKEYVHVNAGLTKLESQFRDAGSTASCLFDELSQLWIEMVSIAEESVVKLQKEIGDEGLYQKFFQENIPPRLTIRLMTYRQVENGKLNAKGHYDGGAITFALAESEPGLWVGKEETRDASGNIIQHEVMNEIYRPDGYILMWPSLTFPGFPATYHGAKQNDSNRDLGEPARTVIVCFLDQIDGPTVTLEQTKGGK